MGIDTNEIKRIIVEMTQDIINDEHERLLVEFAKVKDIEKICNNTVEYVLFEDVIKILGGQNE